MFGLTALWHGDISLLDTTQHAPNPQVMVSMSTLYQHVNMPGPYQHGHHVRGQGPRQPAAQQADRRHHRGAPRLCLHGVWLRPQVRIRSIGSKFALLWDEAQLCLPNVCLK